MQTKPSVTPTATAHTAEGHSGEALDAETDTIVPCLMTPTETAVWLGVTKKCMERWRGNGDGPQFVRLTSKSVRYRPQDLLHFVENRLRASTAAE